MVYGYQIYIWEKQRNIMAQIFIGDINLNYAEIISSVIETKEYCVALLRNQNRVVLISKQSGESKRYILSSSLIGNGTLRECSLLFSKMERDLCCVS